MMTEQNTPLPEQPPSGFTTPQTITPREAYAAGLTAAHNKWLLLIVGVVTLIAGVAALAMPLFASVTITLVLGWVLVISGIVGAFTAFRRQHGSHMLVAFFSAVLSVIIGILMLIQPLIGILTVSALIIAFFAVSGVLRLYYGVHLLKDKTGGGWMIAGGVLSLVLVAVLISGLPFSAVWLPGVLLGIDLITWGTILIAIALRAARLSAAHNEGSPTG